MKNFSQQSLKLKAICPRQWRRSWKIPFHSSLALHITTAFPHASTAGITKKAIKTLK